jgi:uncharacterized protein
MRSLLIFSFSGLLFFSPASGQKNKLEKLIPKEPVGWVSDFENVFIESQIRVLDSIILNHTHETGTEVVIVTLKLDSLSISSLDEFEELSLMLFNQWGIGQKTLNNGVAIIFSRNLRKIRIEVGEGLTAKLTDKEAKSIIDNTIIPEFKRSDYYQGVLNGLQQLLKEIK